MNFINLATLDNVYEAERLSTLLNERGFKTRLHDESDVQRFVFLTKPKAFSIVQVQDGDYSQAVSILQELQERHDPACRHVFSCPDCGSLAVEYPQYTRKYFITPLLLEWAANFGLYDKQFYCRKCHSMWPYETGKRLPGISRDAAVLVAPPN